MKLGKLWFATLLSLGALGAVPAAAQPVVSANVVVTADDSYDSEAPGVPVESVDVFYDQLAPYGMWVDEPTIGRVFIPSQDAFVPYTNGHWTNTSVGFVWVANEPFAAQTSHYGRWSYSQPYARWVWLPDTEWGPSWVSWQQSGDDFGWAPLAPEVVINGGYAPPIESWHYCGASHVLDVNITRYYEPRERVVEIHQSARPMQNYATVSNVKVIVGPSSATLRTYHVEQPRVKIDVKIAGRVSTTTEAHAQVVRAQTNQPQREAQNQKRIQANTHIAAVVAKQPARVEPKQEPKQEAKQPPAKIEAKQPTRVEPTKVEPKKPEPAAVQHTAPTHAVEPAKEQPKQPAKIEPKQPAHEPVKEQPKKPEPAPVQHAAPTHATEPVKEQPKKPEPAPVQHAAPTHTEEPAQHAAPPKPAPTPTPAQKPVEAKKPEAEKQH